MTNQDQSIYQSGQSVLLDGWYEAVAAKMPTASQLSKGEKFPNYDGRAVAWHLLQSVPHYSEIPESQKPKVSESETLFSGMYA